MEETHWPALGLARARCGAPRVAAWLRAEGVLAPLGSVARPDVEALRGFPDAVAIVESGAGLGSESESESESGAAAGLRVELILPAADRDVRLAEIHASLRAQGRIRAWRDEAYPLRDRHGQVHGVVERAASRFWGMMTLGAHCNGYLAGPDGRPTHLWIARRAWTKPTDPGRLDNLVGGGVPLGQSPLEAVRREGWEEAGLRPAQMNDLEQGGLLELDCDVPEGRQLEWLQVFDLALPADFRPVNTDGEVAEHLCLPVDEVIARSAAGELPTDAALAVLDFALRRGLLGAEAPALAQALDGLRPGAPNIIQFD